jgi:hypothetical protein
MLSQILQTMCDTQQSLCAETLAQMLHKDPEVITAMLDELVLLGRVRVDTSESACEACLMKSLCGLPMSSSLLYRLSEAG